MTVASFQASHYHCYSLIFRTGTINCYQFLVWREMFHLNIEKKDAHQIKKAHVDNLLPCFLSKGIFAF